MATYSLNKPLLSQLSPYYSFHSEEFKFLIIFTQISFPRTFVQAHFLTEHSFCIFMKPWYVLLVFQLFSWNTFVHISKEYMFKVYPVCIYTVTLAVG